jgi:hypothetical protein
MQLNVRCNFITDLLFETLSRISESRSAICPPAPVAAETHLYLYLKNHKPTINVNGVLCATTAPDRASRAIPVPSGGKPCKYRNYLILKIFQPRSRPEIQPD